MASIFTKIIKEEIPCYKVAEDNEHFAFLDINPLTKGHTLVIPKVEIDYIFDLNDSQISKLHIFAKKVALALEKVVTCKRIGLSVIGLEVPHAHIHLIPFTNICEMNFANPKLKFSSEDYLLLAAQIQNVFVGLQNNELK